MIVEFKSEQPLTDEACKEATGKTISQWQVALLEQGGTNLKRRDAIQWIHENGNKDAWWCTTIWVEFERAQGILQKDGLLEGYNICVTKTIQATLQDVYKELSNSKSWSQWFGDHVVVQVAEGEKFSDDNQNFGTFLRVRPDKDLRFTWHSLSSVSTTQVDLALAAKGPNKTGITLTHNRIQQREEADGLRVAWAAAFDRLKLQLEKS